MVAIFMLVKMTFLWLNLGAAAFQLTQLIKHLGFLREKTLIIIYIILKDTQKAAAAAASEKM